MKTLISIITNILLTLTLYLLFITPVALYQQNYSIITTAFTKAFLDEKNSYDLYRISIHLGMRNVSTNDSPQYLFQ